MTTVYGIVKRSPEKLTPRHVAEQYQLVRFLSSSGHPDGVLGPGGHTGGAFGLGAKELARRLRFSGGLLRLVGDFNDTRHLRGRFSDRFRAVCSKRDTSVGFWMLFCVLFGGMFGQCLNAQLV